MMRPELHVELLLGRRVVDVDGRVVGRVEEIVAERRGDEYRVAELHLGPAALLERLALSASTVPFLGGLARLAAGRRVPWDRVDWRDPERLRLTCRGDELP